MWLNHFSAWILRSDNYPFRSYCATDSGESKKITTTVVISSNIRLSLKFVYQFSEEEVAHQNEDRSAKSKAKWVLGLAVLQTQT